MQDKRNEIKVDISSIMANMPADPDIERFIIGGLLADMNSHQGVMLELVEKDFTDPKMRTIFGAIRHLFNTDLPVDLITVTAHLKEMSALESVGGATSVAAIMDNSNAGSNLEYITKILREKRILRETIMAAIQTIENAATPMVDIDALISETLSRFERAFDINTDSNAETVGSIAQDYIQEVMRYRSEGSSPVIPTGFKSLDNIIGGLPKSSLIVLAGRPGEGKSQFALSLAHNAALSGIPSIVFSLEMSKGDYIQRLIMMHTGVSTLRMRVPKDLSGTELTLMENAVEEDIARLPIYVDDTPEISLDLLRFRAKRAKIQHHVGLVVVDYLQLVKGPKESREQEIASISRGLKGLAKELDVPVLALSQLNRSSVREKRDPQLSDLRESGSLEQDADVVIFILSNDKAYGIGSECCTEILVPKSRQGPLGRFSMRYNKDSLLFEESFSNTIFENNPRPTLEQLESGPSW